MRITTGKTIAKVIGAVALALGPVGWLAPASGDEALASTQAAGGSDTGDMLARMLSGRSAVEGDELEELVKKASAHPFGSKENPVRAEGPAGQRAYLARLRCADLKRPEFYRAGSAGLSPYGNIVDIYVGTCKGSEPAESSIYIDMYHGGHIEDAAVPGFGIVGGREAG